jgi:serine phosphatase RsbU (regulator of sigma subunit)
MDGLVYGYNYDSSKKLLKKEKQIKVEGVLDHVSIDVLEDGKIIKTTQTNSNGLFLIKIKTGKKYLLELSKSGYSTVSLIIDITGVPNETASKGVSFRGAELILNSFQSKNAVKDNQPFGKLFYNTTENHLDFEEVKIVSKKLRGSNDNPVSLMKRSVQKNKNNKNEEDIGPDPILKKESKANPVIHATPEKITKEVQKKTNHDSISKALSEFKLKATNDLNGISADQIYDLENKISAARIQLEKDKLNANTDEDLTILKEREYLLNTIELQLAEAKRLIELQKNEISNQRKLLFLTIAFILLLSGLLFMIYRFSKQKKKIYLLLKDKNRKITDSINYALRIQESILPSDTEIKKLLAQSFVFFKPRDIVSGDFYWLSSVNEKTIIACVDCTGHGVPGAFMSLIGNTLLNEIINEKQIANPAIILKRLHQEIIKALHQDSERIQSKDGMEMSLCVIDTKTNIIEFAGAMNPLFIVKDNMITVIKPDIKGIGGDGNQNKEVEFTNQFIPIQKDMSVYMFTDGYMDQFGGPENKKFNIPNFKKLLLEMQLKEMDQQKEIIEQTIKKWQGNNKQIDDMLVIGIRF